jgi:TatD DNase family protein
MYVDTHAHLWFDDYQNDLKDVIARAKLATVEKFVVPGTDIESSRKAIELAKIYPDIIYSAIGIHPEEVGPGKFDIESNIGELNVLIGDNRGLVHAIGEIGTDASSDALNNCLGEQKELFLRQCEMALTHDLPVIIHTRNSLVQALEVLDSLPSMPRGQFHCFSHDEEGIKQVLSRGFFVSFCGNISWSKRVAKLVSLIPDEKLLLETDSPLMVPRDKRRNPIHMKERNEPANVVYLAKIIADLRGQDLQKIAKITSDNAKTLYRL